MLRAYVGTFLSLAGLACGLTWLYLGMRSVMEIGGACAEGGPYEIAQPCPDGVPMLMLGGIFGGLISLALFLFFSSRLGGQYGNLAGWAWSALFLSLGWNFFEFGFDPPGEDDGLVFGWLFCGVLFALMGGLPLLGLAKPSNLRKMLWPPDEPAPSTASSYAPAPGLARSRVISDRDREDVGRPGAPGYHGPPRAASTAAPAVPASGDVVARLERLAALRERGALDEDEYEQAKKAVLDG